MSPDLRGGFHPSQGFARIADERLGWRSLGDAPGSVAAYRSVPFGGWCDGCWRTETPVIAVGPTVRTTGGKPSYRLGVTLCADCLAEILQVLTGFGWVNQLSAWRRMSEATRKRPRRVVGWEG